MYCSEFLVRQLSGRLDPSRDTDMNFTRHYDQLAEKVDALSLRERLFVLGAVLVVTGGLWEAVLASPLAARKTEVQKSIESISERLAQLDETIIITAQGLDGGVDNEADRLRQLRQQVLRNEETVRIFTSDLIDPGQMRFVIEDLILQQNELRLIRAENLPVSALIPPDENDPSPDDDDPNLYRHGLFLELEGAYLPVLNYLTSIERLPWQIYWGRIDIETLEHPTLRVLIELHTLSLEQEWIGV